MKKVKCFINAGHGGTDGGCVTKAMKEKDINLKVAKYLEAHLKKCGFETKMSRTTDVFIELDDTCYMANKWGANVFVAIHHNGGGGVGSEVIHSIYHGVGLELAEEIAVQFKALGQKAHRNPGYYDKEGVKEQDYFAVIRETKMPAVITEYAFVDSAIDSKKIDTDKELEQEAIAIAKALCKEFNVKYVA